MLAVEVRLRTRLDGQARDVDIIGTCEIQRLFFNVRRQHEIQRIILNGLRRNWFAVDVWISGKEMSGHTISHKVGKRW